jgi:transcriptional regulator with XRE-family HTH domain
MNYDRVGSLIREVRRRRRLRQVDVAAMAGVSHATVSLVERGKSDRLTPRTLEAIASALEVHLELYARWRGGEAERLLNRKHSLLAESVVKFFAGLAGWTVRPEVSFNVYGERGVVDLVAWNPATRHLLVIELKTQFVVSGS